MTVQTINCLNVNGKPKERFPSERSARRSLAHRRIWQHRRFPAVYKCPCGAYHLTNGAES